MKVIFMEEQTEYQICFGNNDNPNGLLTVGEIYEILKREIHSWHTKLILVDFPDKKFNDITFEYIHGE